ncbi:MAG TPA: 2-C-methyl-D-erythritol 4-phosphate cytidylyltransferase [Verrucomicrobiae bacterium]|nr:2-C-methyl-D-erythritol 4-phosphate cytidylyltransferase [Verrucomicrobiae bacterium]
MHNAAIIVAAGRGTRMGPNIDKLFLEVAGHPVIFHSWLRFDAADCIHEIVLVVRDGLQSAFVELANELRPSKPFRLVCGGKERQDSVWNGLSALGEGVQVVAIHDGARPCVTEELISRTIAVAGETGAAVAGQPVTDTIKESSDGVVISQHLDRGRLWSVQTPQCFRLDVIRRALSLVREKELLVTDDTAACEWIDQPVTLVEGQRPNPKVTVAEDLGSIETILRSLEPRPRDKRG